MLADGPWDQLEHVFYILTKNETIFMFCTIKYVWFVCEEVYISDEMIRINEYDVKFQNSVELICYWNVKMCRFTSVAIMFVKKFLL